MVPVGSETPEDEPSEILHSVAALAAMVSHEINNPLMAIIANLELLGATRTRDEYGRARLGAALAAAARIKETIRRLARITRLELAAAGPNLPPMLDLERSSPGTNGEYGVCVECAERISPARLHAVPEVDTCVRCQDGIERFARRM